METINRLLGVIAMFALTLSGYANMRTFEKFKAESVVGAYNMPWYRVGPTDKGCLYGVGFYLENGDETSPTLLWRGAGMPDPIEVNSISAINSVAKAYIISSASPSEMRSASDIYAQLIGRKVAAHGKTGFSLDVCINSKIPTILAQLAAQGISKESIAQLQRLSSAVDFECDQHIKLWTRTWYEVDAQGYIECIVLKGVLDPMRLTSISKECITEQCVVNPGFLMRDKLFGIIE